MQPLGVAYVIAIVKAPAALYMDHTDEQTLVEQAKTDPHAFGVLFDAYYPKIANYILHRVGDTVVAQDLTAETFVKAWQGIGAYTWRGVPFAAWLYRIASNEVASYFRGRKHAALSLDELAETSGFELPSDINIEQAAIAAQDEQTRYRQYRLVRELLHQLPAKYQEVLALRYFEKKPLGDIALITGKRLGTIKSLLSRGTAKLQQEFIRRQGKEL